MSATRPDPRRALPAVDAALRDPDLARLADEHGRARVADAVRAALSSRRAAGTGPEGLADEVAERMRPGIERVLNATGVLLNTNLGRAQLAPAAIAAAVAAAGACALEWDPESGERGARAPGVAEHLRALTGAEDALAVATNAGAVLLALCTLAVRHGGRPAEVLVSRGELVEIGGGFRVPEILAASGCRLVEVGTTNRTRAADYAAACGPRTAVILRVHRSNFRQTGFVEDPDLDELVALAQDRDLALVDDLGGGALVPDPLFPGEPDVRASVAAGADLVAVSADKLLGGPQAGLLAGRADAVAAARAHPLARALRPGKLDLAALEATLALHRDAATRGAVPLIARLSEDPARRRERAERLARACGAGRVVATAGRVGGGTLPDHEVTSFALALDAPDADALARALRRGRPRVAPRVRHGRVEIDLLAIADEGVDELAAAITAALAT